MSCQTSPLQFEASTITFGQQKALVGGSIADYCALPRRLAKDPEERTVLPGVLLSPAVRDWRRLLHQHEQVLVNQTQASGDLKYLDVAAPLV